MKQRFPDFIAKGINFCTQDKKKNHNEILTEFLNNLV